MPEDLLVVVLGEPWMMLPAGARAAMYAGNTAVQPADVAAMVLAVLALPPNVDVARFDILPLTPASVSGATTTDK